jgi:hypothetical protein
MISGAISLCPEFSGDFVRDHARKSPAAGK